jgi:hypothetical protein
MAIKVGSVRAEEIKNKNKCCLDCSYTVFVKMVEALTGIAPATRVSWPPEASIILYGDRPNNRSPSISSRWQVCG